MVKQRLKKVIIILGVRWGRHYRVRWGKVGPALWGKVG